MITAGSFTHVVLRFAEAYHAPSVQEIHLVGCSDWWGHFFPEILSLYDQNNAGGNRVMELLAAVFFGVSLAYANGANDNFKGVATLFGSGTTDYRVALRWATATTFAGSLVALALASELLQTFSGRGLVPESVLQTRQFPMAVAGAAAFTAFLTSAEGEAIFRKWGYLTKETDVRPLAPQARIGGSYRLPARW